MRHLRWLDRTALTNIVGFSFQQLVVICRSVERNYRYTRKQAGSKVRDLHVPRRRLKLIQSRLYRRVFRHFDYHPAVYCCKGRGTLDVARAHAGHSHLLHLDIAGFFPSITVGRVRNAFSQLGVPAETIGTLTQLVTINGAVPQGAPTSVAVGNLVLLDVDRSVWGLCNSSGAGFTYTRYVDDIAISGGARLSRFRRTIDRIIQQDCGWRLNEKGGLFGPDERHTLVGLVVNTKPNVDSAYIDEVDWLLRKAAQGDIDISPKHWRSLRGRAQWIATVNPDRGRRLLRLAELAELEAPNLPAAA